MQDQILILNFDNAYSATIASRLRAERIAAKILPGHATAEQVLAQESLGVILSGGINGDIPVSLDGQLLRSGIPVLALGNVVPAVITLLGGQVEEAVPVNDVDTLTFLPSRVTEGLGESERMFGTLFPLCLTDDLEPLATYHEVAVGASHKTQEIYAVGCQLEPNDPDMFNLMVQFATKVCGCTSWWSEDAFISLARSAIQEAAGEERAVCVMSGGLDSGVTALIAHRALGDRLTCLFVDSGLHRENEVVEFAAYYKNLGLQLNIINARERVLAALAGKINQEDKRIALHEVLSRALEEAAASIDYGLQVISSSSDHLFAGRSAPASLPLLKPKVHGIAPLGDLFKDEIRRIGEALGMPHEMTNMQSFPWSGLALRIMGECTVDKINLLRWADYQFCNDIKEAGLSRRLWKYFAMLYEIPYQEEQPALAIALRALSISHTGSDLRALPARLPYDLLERYTQRAQAYDKRIHKIIYDLTPSASLQESEWR